MKREYKNRVVFWVMTIVICGVLILGVGSFCNRSNAQEVMTNQKYYKSIEIHAGDTLWDIAQTYCSEEYDSIDSYMEEVRSINQLNDDKILTGGYLMIPYYAPTNQMNSALVSASK